MSQRGCPAPSRGGAPNTLVKLTVNGLGTIHDRIHPPPPEGAGHPLLRSPEDFRAQSGEALFDPFVAAVDVVDA